MAGVAAASAMHDALRYLVNAYSHVREVAVSNRVALVVHAHLPTTAKSLASGSFAQHSFAT